MRENQRRRKALDQERRRLRDPKRYQQAEAVSGLYERQESQLKKGWKAGPELKNKKRSEEKRNNSMKVLVAKV